jgi:hypothetical protein
MFPNKTLSRECSEYEVDGGSNFGCGVPNTSRAHIVSFMGAFVKGVSHTFVCNVTFFQALYLPFIFCGLNIERYEQWKVKEHHNGT